MVLGALDENGGQDYLKRQAKENPPAFMKLLGQCLPKDVKVTATLDGDIVIRFSNGKVQA